MIPVIAIVGRANVGKSTLFNRLTASRDALVSDFPGMTRDRQYGQANVADHRFIVIDTAGIGDDETEIDKLTAQQSLQAVEEADKILFVVDGRSGLTPIDLSIVATLRKLNKDLQKPLYLVVNKTENIDTAVATADFYQLGLGTPYPIAAAHGHGVKTLIQHVFANDESISTEESPIEDDRIKLAIIGRPNVGKSTLTNRMLGEERVIVFDQPGTTRDSIFIPLDRLDKKYTLIDTAGIRRRGKIFEATEKFSVVKTLQAIESTHVVLYVINAREGITDHDLRLIGFVIDSGKALVIAINKWDGMTTLEKDEVHRNLDRRLHFADFARIHYISALHGSGVGNLFASIDEAYTSAKKKLSTPQLNKILQEILVAHTPPLIRGRRIKLRYAHAGGQNPPLIIIHGNQVESLPDDYKRYIANTYQKRLKLVGTPVRIELKSSENPFEGRRNVLTPTQRRKKLRMLRHVKRK